LNKALGYLLPQKGKQIRPVLVILAAKAVGKATQNTNYLASAYELLHLASLIHDDVVDNSEQRRNRPSLNKAFDNKTAVLVGDYLLTKSINFALLTKNMEYLELLQNFGSLIVRGELLQQQHSHNFIKDEDYFTVIKHKTASLFAICAKSGALTGGGDYKQVKALSDFGENLGICFQIKDDIFDYKSNKSLGKPLFNDITEGKITLPLIYTLSKSAGNEEDKVLQILHSNTVSKEDIDFVSNLIINYKGIECAEVKMLEFRQQALDCIEVIPDSAEKNLLIELLNYAINREF
jgi:octaprenyl-diphosphate synthase